MQLMGAHFSEAKLLNVAHFFQRQPIGIQQDLKSYKYDWQTVIGLECMPQLKTHSKLFSSAPTTYGAPANTQTSFIDAGLPGVLRY